MVVEQVAQRLVQEQSSTSKPIRVPSLLSLANRSAGRDRVRTTEKKATAPGKVSVPPACRNCGMVLDDTSRLYCDACLPGYQQAQATAFSDAGRVTLAELRAVGKDPSKGGQARRRRGEKISKHMDEQSIWEAKHGLQVDRDVYRLEILPHLGGVPLRTLATVTGLSEQYCSLIRRGLKISHARHWQALRVINSHKAGNDAENA